MDWIKDEDLSPFARRLKKIAQDRGFLPEFNWQGRCLNDVLKDYTTPTDEDLNDRWLERGAKTMPFRYALGDKRQTGLEIWIAPTGKKKWSLQTMFPGQQSQARRKLGFYPTLSLKAARVKAAAWLALVKDGIDPADAAREKAEAAAEERRKKALQNKQTFGAFVEEYITSRKNRRKEADAREIRRMLVPEWGSRSIHEITPRDVKALFPKLVRQAPYDAKNAWLHASSIFKLAVFDELIAVSPLASVDRTLLFPEGTIKARERALKDHEVVAFWRGTEKLGTPYAEFYKLLMLTGLRKNELAQARWAELDPALRKALRDARAAAPVNKQTPKVNWSTLPDEIKILRVPASRFKSDREHVVQLSHDALDIIATLPRGECLLSTDGTRPINGMSKAKKRLDGFMLVELRKLAEERGEDPAQVKLEAWVNHDLRRTVRTNLSKLKVPFVVAEIVLGHKLGGLHATYDVHGYESEQREALEKWAVRLREIVTPPTTPTATADNVVALTAQKRKRAS
jgi:integrase